MDRREELRNLARKIAQMLKEKIQSQKGLSYRLAGKRICA